MSQQLMRSGGGPEKAPLPPYNGAGGKGQLQYGYAGDQRQRELVREEITFIPYEDRERVRMRGVLEF